MMPLNATYRRLLLKHIPQLTPADVDRYENLIALYTQLNFEQGMSSGKRSLKDDPAKESYEQAQKILAPVTKQYKKVNQQWNARRDFALAQGDVSQIPNTFKGTVTFAWLGIKFYGINVYTTLYLWLYKLTTYYRHKITVSQIVVIIIFLVLLILGLLAIKPVG